MSGINDCSGSGGNPATSSSAGSCPVQGSLGTDPQNVISEEEGVLALENKAQDILLRWHWSTIVWLSYCITGVMVPLLFFVLLAIVVIRVYSVGHITDAEKSLLIWGFPSVAASTSASNALLGYLFRPRF